MNRFIKNLLANGEDVMKRRAKNIGEQAEIAYRGIIDQLLSKKRKLELKKDELTDLSPDTTNSLRPAGKEFDAVKWAQEIQTVSEEIWNIDQALSLAQENYKFFFEEIKEDKKK